jgi:hypothetical protein
VIGLEVEVYNACFVRRRDHTCSAQEQLQQRCTAAYGSLAQLRLLDEEGIAK